MFFRRFDLLNYGSLYKTGAGALNGGSRRTPKKWERLQCLSVVISVKEAART